MERVRALHAQLKDADVWMCEEDVIKSAVLSGLRTLERSIEMLKKEGGK
ncbi:MAG: hypothetical protein QW429_04945 [Thermoprotei archaeon]